MKSPFPRIRPDRRLGAREPGAGRITERDVEPGRPGGRIADFVRHSSPGCQRHFARRSASSAWISSAVRFSSSASMRRAHELNEPLWLVAGHEAAARAEDLDTFFASPLKGVPGLADAVLVRHDWSILVGGLARPGPVQVQVRPGLAAARLDADVNPDSISGRGGQVSSWQARATRWAGMQRGTASCSRRTPS